MTTQNGSNANGFDLGHGEEFDAGLVNTIDQESVEGGGPSFPLIQWTYGNNKLKELGADKMGYAGGWFTNSDMVDAATMIAAGWTKANFTHANGSETEGFYRRQIAISMIAARQRWEVTDSSGRMVFPWLNGGYDAAKAAGRPIGRMHILCIVKDLESLGPVVLTLKGAASKAFKGGKSGGGVEKRFNDTVIAAANAASVAKGIKARWPYRAFWCPVGADRDAAGNPVFTEVGSGKDSTHLVLPIALGLPEKKEGVDLKRFYVGNAMLENVNALYAEYGEWMTAWDRMEAGTVEGNGNGANGSGNGANGSGSATPEQAAPAVDILAATGL